MNLFGMLELSGSALTAERQRAEVVTANMANAETTRTPEGGPYQRKLVVFRSRENPRFPQMLNAGLLPGDQPGVQVEQVVADASPPQMRYEPGSPDADKNGFVAYPNIDPVNEMVDLMGAVRAYEMNSSAVQATKSMIQQSIDLLK
jgi:flagellar basal-body rod protein FlgC